MSDGRILWAGGMNLGSEPTDVPHYPDSDIFGNYYTYIFDPDPPNPNEEWKPAGGTQNPHAMANQRYYPTLIHLGVISDNTITGNIVAFSGWIDLSDPPNLNREPQYYDETDGWQDFPHPEATQPFNGLFDYYPSAHLIPSGPNAGKIFFSLPMKQSYIFNPYWNGVSEPGYWSAIGDERTGRYRLNGTSTMLPLLPPYESAKVIIIGGSTSESSYQSHAINSAEIIDIASSSPEWSLKSDFLFYARKNHVSLMLPNDMLFVVGGNDYDFGDGPVFSAELVDTSQENLQSSMLPAHVYPRCHHTTALLLPDATVFLGGSGEVGEAPIVMHFEIYEPGYLFDMPDLESDRPVITSAPLEITYGENFNIVTSHPIESVRLIRFGAVTHSTEMSQLSIGLDFNPGDPYEVIMENVNKNIAPPGMYMLFVLRPKSASLSGETMIPSVAKIVMVS